MKILITGTTSGIGLKLAQDYLAAGNTVYCCGRNQTVLQQLVDAYGERAIPVSFDVQDREGCLAALAALPGLDLVILNAGTCEYIDASNFDAASFERVIRINLIGLANCLQALIPKLAAGSSLSLMGSSSSYLPLPRAEAYGASKAAIEYLAKTLAITLGKGRHPRQLYCSGICRDTLDRPQRFSDADAGRCRICVKADTTGAREKTERDPLSEAVYRLHENALLTAKRLATVFTVEGLNVLTLLPSI